MRTPKYVFLAYVADGKPAVEKVKVVAKQEGKRKFLLLADNVAHVDILDIELLDAYNIEDTNFPHCFGRNELCALNGLSSASYLLICRTMDILKAQRTVDDAIEVARRTAMGNSLAQEFGLPMSA